MKRVRRASWVSVLGTLVWLPCAVQASSGVGDEWGRGSVSGAVPHARGDLPAALSFAHGPGSSSGGAVVLAHRRRSRPTYGRPETYTLLKAGGLRVGEDPTADGLFLGFEVGGVVEDLLEIGFNTDYFYRSSETVYLHSESRIDRIPVELVAFERTSAHLVPLGLTLRLVLPFAGETLRPFVSGTVSYEMLFLENASFDPDDPVLGWLAQEETFTGFGWQAAAGARLQLGPTVGLFGEVGYHDSAPSQRYLVDGLPVDLKVDLSGPFLRGGLRFRL